jgi:hypothetical protein
MIFRRVKSMEQKDRPQLEEKQQGEDPKRTQEWERGKDPPSQSEPRKDEK